MAYEIQLRHDTAANWTSANPTLAQGEAGYETDTGKLKVGDGSTAWTSLAYFASGGAALTVTDGTTSVSDVTEIDFTSNATVTDGGGGTADVAVSGGGGSSTSLVTPINANPAQCGASAAPGANVIWGCRIIIPKSGTLHDLAVFIGSSAGNLDIGIYDTAATTRNLLYHSGAVASPGAGWQIIGDPAMTVTVGDMYDFAIVGSGTAQFQRFTGANTLQYKLPAGFIPGGGAGPWLGWQATAIGSILQATLAESGFSNVAPVAIIGRVS